MATAKKTAANASAKPAAKKVPAKKAPAKKVAAKRAVKIPLPPLPPLKLNIEMVPTSAWGQNLRLSIPASKWDKLRKAVHEKNGNKCETCGSDYRLSCHEEWDFNEETGIQKLNCLGSVCGMCHHVAHIGRSKQLASQGVLDIDAVVQHFLTVNGVGMEVFAQAESEAINKWLRQSTIEWKPDYGEYAALIPAVPVRPRK